MFNRHGDKNPLVSIVILNWNGLEDTKLCLENVFKLDYDNYEVILLDNGSSPDQKRYFSTLKNIIYVDNPANTGFAGGHDDALPHTNGDFILLLNNDAVIKSDYIRAAMNLFDDPQVAVVGGRSYFWNESAPLFNESNPYYAYMNVDPISAETTLLTQDYGLVQEVNTVSGSAVIVRRTVISELGYLYRPFFAYYEETDLFSRFKRGGYKIMYNPKLCIWHKNGASSGAQGGSSFFYYHIFRNRFTFALRNFDNDFVYKFLRSFIKEFIRSCANGIHGSNQRRLAWSYLNAILTSLINLPTTLRTRRELASKLSMSYGQQIIQEQLSVSVVIDGTDSSKSELQKIELTLKQNVNPIHEYIIVTNDESFSDVRTGNFRYVLNRGYFNNDTLPLSLGCVAATSDWLILCTIDNIPTLGQYLPFIAKSYDTSMSAVITDGFQSIAVQKKYYQKMGGLSASIGDLESNIRYIAEYSNHEKKLLSLIPVPISLDDQGLKSKISYDNHLQSLQKPSKWLSFLACHYRILQLSHLISWVFNSGVPIRLKLARLKNILVFTISLQRKKLATELKHIRNEAQNYSKKGGALSISHAKSQTIKKIAAETALSVSEIPVFIICYERVNNLKTLVTWLERIGQKKIVFIDNDSTYQPLLDYYNETPYQKIRLYQNIGHTSPWSLDIIRTLVPNEFYIVTDPDVIPIDQCPDDVISHLLSIHQENPSHVKVGLGLKIDDIPDSYALKEDVISWESQFWKTQLSPGVYEAGVDTTFALYKPFTYFYTLNPSLRTDSPYIARHMPWYSSQGTSSDEDTYYKIRANAHVTSWNVDELPERYKKEIRSAKK